MNAKSLISRCLNAYWQDSEYTIDAIQRMQAVLALVSDEVREWAPAKEQARICHTMVHEIADRLLRDSDQAPQPAGYQPAVQGLEPSPEIKLVPPKRAGQPGRPPVLDAEQARDVLRRRAEGETYMAIAIHYGVSMTAITNICYGVTYRELPGRAA